MAVAKFSDFKRWAGKLFNKADWEYNLQKIIDWLTDGAADLTVGSVTVNGAVDAETLSGNGAGITGIAGISSKEYLMFYKYPFVAPNLLNVMSLQNGTIDKVEVKLGVDGGVMLDALDVATAWTAEAACTTLAVNTYANSYLAGGGAVGWVKDATSTIAKMYKTCDTWNATGAKMRTDVYLPSITDVASVRIWAHSSANTDYCYYDITANVAGSSLAVGWNKVEVDFSDTPTATIGSFNVGSIARYDLGITTGAGASTSGGQIRWDSLVYQLNGNDSHRLDFDLTVDNTVIKPSAATNSFNGVLAGAVTSLSSGAFSTVTIDTNSLIGLNVYNVSSSFAGENLSIAVYTV